jgi:sugar fermentation stimulation protein A
VPWVYVLRCRDGSLYTGAAKDLERRLAQHDAGRASRYTRARLPVTLVHARRLRTWGGALREEYRLKQLSRTEKERLVAESPPPTPGGVRFEGLVPATFIARPNRFLVHADVGGQRVIAACRDPGRLERLLVPGVDLLLAPASGGSRRTFWDVVLARQGRAWVSVMPALANRLLDSAIAARTAPGLRGARVIAREVVHGHSRFDFTLRHRGRTALLEVKSVGLVVRGRALFPDAPTARGLRHLCELSEHARRGEAAMLAFVVQRQGARSVAPHVEIDPDFARALAEAARAGVRLLAFGCRVSPRGISIVRRLPVRLPRS